MTAADVMNKVAALLNDSALTSFTYAAQLPYLNMALAELEETFEQNNIPVTNAVSSALTIPAGVTSIGFNTTPALPIALVEIQQVWEKLAGTDPYIQMTRLEFLPHYMEGTLLTNFIWWVWQEQEIKVLASSQDNQIKIDYIKSLFPEITASTGTINLINSKSFLQYRTAALCAQFIGEDKERADDLNVFAVMALDRTVGISVKGGQAIKTRRRPFRAGAKMRNYV